MHNDIVDNMDSSKVTALTLLNFSAAFDTSDYSILLQRLHRHFGIDGRVLLWLKPYFSNRHQSINISGTLSCPQHLPIGVPQGSVIGPVLFSLYTTSLSQVISLMKIHGITWYKMVFRLITWHYMINCGRPCFFI